MHVYFEDWNVLGEMKQWSLRQHTEGIRALNSLASWIQRFIEGLQQWGTMILFLTCTNIGQFNHPGSDSTKALNTKLFIRRFNKLCKSCAFVSLVCLHLQFSDNSSVFLAYLRTEQFSDWYHLMFSFLGSKWNRFFHSFYTTGAFSH